MENNQHHRTGSHPDSAATPFTNEQPGQQPPATGDANQKTAPSNNVREIHSESSQPTGEHETLGTP